MVTARFRGGLCIVVMVAAEGGDLDNFPPEAHVDDTKAAPDDAGVAEQGVYGFRRGVGGDVEVLGMPSQQQVPDSAAYQVGLMPAVTQARHYLESAVADVFAGDAVLVPGDDIQTKMCL